MQHHPKFKSTGIAILIAAIFSGSVVLAQTAPAAQQAPVMVQQGGHRYVPPTQPGATGAAATAANGDSSRQRTAQGAQPSVAPMPSPLPARNLVQDSLDQSVPMDSDEIRRFLTELLKRNQAANENYTGRSPAKPVTSVESLDLSPGATPPVVRVAMGQGAVISFADAAGRPWAIADDINFNAAAYEVKLIAPHLYTVKLNKPAAANITVVLKDLPRPIVITALPATDEADYLKEFTVPRFIDGVAPPSVVTAVNSGGLALNAPELLNYLYRTPPKEAKALGVLGMPGVMAWQNSQTTMVVRTSGLLVIPAWMRRHSSTDGVSVYEIPLSPVVTIAQDGMQHRLSVNGFIVPNKNSASNN